MKGRNIFKTIISGLFSRLTVTIAAIVIEVVYVLLILFRFSEYAAWVSVGFRAVSFFLIAVVIYHDHNPAYKIAWIVLISVLPQIGVLLYLLYGERRTAKSMKKKLEPVERAHEEELKQTVDLGELDERRQGTAHYLADHGKYPAWGNTQLKYYDVGEKMYKDFFEDLENAQHFIFIEFFIIGKGQIWDHTFEILKKKVAEGVDVRIFYDDLGSLPVSPPHFLRDIKEAGIKVMAFNMVRPIFSLVYNHRDHRKIAVIDGYIGYNGGVNLADEYANLFEKHGHWKDTAVRLYGEGVWNFTCMFLNMWNAFDPQDSDYQVFSPHRWHPEPFDGEGFVQPYSDNPLDDEDLGRNVYLEIINMAQKYVYIYTPYLIIDNELETALRLAAKRGVDVRIVTPGIPDHKIVYTITRSYYRTLLRSGVKVYEYTPGFIHAKCFLSDDNIGVVGSINLDFRSLYLHFECATLIMENKTVFDAMKKDYLDTFSKSHLVSEEDRRKYPISNLVGFVFRVLSPLM